MECTSEKCKKKLRKRLQVLHGSLNVSSESSLSAVSETHSRPFLSLSRKRKKASCHSKRDYLSRLFERKKLKDKSLSKKLRTPFDRKINRTCWPIELSKVSKIKKKPREKRREKPTHRSLTRREYSDTLVIPSCKENSPQISCSEFETIDDDSSDEQIKFSNKKFVSCYKGDRPHIIDLEVQKVDSWKSSNLDFLSKYRERSPSLGSSNLKFNKNDTCRKFWEPKLFPQCKPNSSQISCGELEFLNNESFIKVYQYLIKRPFHDQVTPELLLEILQYPEYAETGATIDMIIQEIRIQNKNLNPEVHLLKEEVAVMLLWAVTLGVIIEENGYYKIAESFQKENENISLIWDWWYRRMKGIRK